MEIQLDAGKLLKLAGTMIDQAPFAAKNALNDVALELQTEQRAHDRSIFTARRGDWLDRNVKVGFATKRNLMSSVSIIAPGGQKNDVLGKFERGGKKTSRGAHGMVAIPLQVRKTKTGLIPAALRPKALSLRDVTAASDRQLGKGTNRSFILQLANGTRAIFQRVGNRSKKARGIHGPLQAGKDRNLRLLYILKRSVGIKADLHLVDHGRAVAARSWAKRFGERFHEAIRSAR